MRSTSFKRKLAVVRDSTNLGAFSEIFKATHKVSHVQRAVKVILKAKTNASL